MTACIVHVYISMAVSYVKNSEDPHENPAVTLFREYLRIPSISRGEDYQKHYGEAVILLWFGVETAREAARRIGLFI